MEKKKRLAGRFLPSRVYARWKWTVRSGLSALPLVLFLSGALTLYLTQARYRSTVVFEYLGSRPAAEAAALVKSRNVVEPAVKELGLTNRLEIDMDSLFRIITRTTKITVDEETGMIRLQVTNTNKEVARDVAGALAASLDAYEKSLATDRIRQRLELAEIEENATGDEAEEKQKLLARLISLRGADKGDPLSQLDLDAARGEWEHAQRQLLDVRTRISAEKRELANPGKWVAVHTQPVISNNAVKPDESWQTVILRALGAGLVFSLCAPYLLELAFPRVYKPRTKEGDRWGEAAEINGLPV
jgi:hypothetical protein